MMRDFYSWVMDGLDDLVRVLLVIVFVGIAWRFMFWATGAWVTAR